MDDVRLRELLQRLRRELREKDNARSRLIELLRAEAPAHQVDAAQSEAARLEGQMDATVTLLCWEFGAAPVQGCGMCAARWDGHACDAHRLTPLEEAAQRAEEEAACRERNLRVVEPIEFEPTETGDAA